MFTAVLSVVFSLYSPIGLGSLNAVQSMLIGILFLAILPTAPVLYYVVRRKIDINVSAREKRTKFYLLASASMLASVIIFWFSSAAIMFAYSLSVFIVTLIIAFINMKWKISAHSSSVSSDANALLYVYGTFLWPISIMIPIVSIVRYKAKAHSIAQLVAGIIVGITMTLISYIVFYP